MITYLGVEGNTLGPPFRVVVVDDHSLPRVAARAMLASSSDLVLVGEAGSGEEALAIVPDLKPDVVLMDVDMKGMDGAQAAEKLLASDPELRIVAWTVSEAGDDLLRMLQVGCAGYVLKDVGAEELQRAIRAALRQDTPMPRRMLPDVVRRVAVQQPAKPTEADVHLTKRELEVLRMVGKGMTSKRMATELGLAVASVDTYLRTIYRKLGATNRGQAVNFALKKGVLALSDL